MQFEHRTHRHQLITVSASAVAGSVHAQKSDRQAWRQLHGHQD